MAKRFEHLLNAMERAAQADEPNKAGYPAARAEVLRYVRGLEALRDAVRTLQLAAIGSELLYPEPERSQVPAEVIGG